MEDAMTQQGSQFDERQNDKKMKLPLYDESNNGSNACRPLYDESNNGVEKGAMDMKRERKIVPLLDNEIQQLPSGTGRNVLVSCLILRQLDYTLLECQALILAPTREGAQQMEHNMRLLARGHVAAKIHAIVGDEEEASNVREEIHASIVGDEEEASNVREEIHAAIVGNEEEASNVREENHVAFVGDEEEEASGVNESHVVVGTPADVLDLLNSKSFSPRNIRMFILDDADKMLSLGLKDQIYEIFELLPSNLQLGVFAASTPSEVYEFTSKIINKPLYDFNILKEALSAALKKSRAASRCSNNI